MSSYAKKIKVGFIGAGRISSLNALGYLDNPHAELYAVCDKSKRTARKRAKQWRVPRGRVFTDHRDLLALDALDAVEVLTPHSYHCQQVIDACAAGKHVSVQKVPAMRISEFDRMVDAAQKAGVKLKIYENFQFHPPYVRALEILRSGAIGRPLAVNVRMWQGIDTLSQWKVPKKAWLWRIQEKNNYKSPTLFDDGYHKHNIVHLFLDRPIERVQTWVGGYKLFKMVNLDSPAVVVYKTGGHEYGTFNVSMAPTLPMQSDYYACEESVEIQAEKGLMWINGCTGNMFCQNGCVQGPGRAGVHWIDEDGVFEHDCSMPTNWKHSFINCTQDFIDAIREDREPYRSGAAAREVLQITLALIASWRRNGQDVAVASITDGVPDA